MTRRSRLPWVMRLPGGLRDQPAWVFIGGMCFLSGLSYLVGIAESNSITSVLGPVWLRVWGGFLCLSGGMVAWSTWAGEKALERLSLRFLSLGLLVYMGWILTVVPFARATLIITLCLSLIGLSEIRSAVLKMALRPLPPARPEVQE